MIKIISIPCLIINKKIYKKIVDKMNIVMYYKDK